MKLKQYLAISIIWFVYIIYVPIMWVIEKVKNETNKNNVPQVRRTRKRNKKKETIFRNRKGVQMDEDNIEPNLYELIEELLIKLYNKGGRDE